MAYAYPEEDALGMSVGECLAFMQDNHLVDVCVQSVMKWSKGRYFDHYVRLGKFMQAITIKSTRKAKKHVTIAIESMTDLRLTPFTDDSDEHALPAEEQELFFSVGFWDKNCHQDFVNVMLLNIKCTDKKTCLIWRKGLRHLIAKNSWQSPRYLTPAETSLRVFAVFLGKQVDPTKASRKALARCICHDSVSELDSVLEDLGLEPHFDAAALSQLEVEVLMARCTAHPDLLKLFMEVASNHDNGDGYLTSQELEQLLRTTQRDKRANEVLEPFVTPAECRRIIEELEPDPQQRSKGRLSYVGFLRLLRSEYWDPIQPARRDVHQDMGQPLAHYFMASSHNTYLTGSQLNSKSTVEMYRQVLLSGCRCIELDTWDGSKEPVITHGMTRCTRVDFRKVVEAIKEYAFVTTAYPLILSIENHCSVPQMKIMAAVFKASFGSYLLSDFFPGDGPDSLPNVLPPLEKLKYKILIKNKKTTISDADKSATLQARALVPANGLETLEPMAIVVDGEMVKEDEEEARQRRERSKEIAKELSDLVNYVTPFSFQGFEVSRQLNNCYLMSSFNESKAMRFVAGSPKEFVQYGRTNTSRIYPSGSRVASSNFNPQIFWNVGSQMVSLNYQTGGPQMQLNLGKFAVNGRCGYILKPRPFTHDPNFDPFEKQVSLQGITPLDIKIEVLAAQHLGKKDMAPFVQIHLYGLPSDTNKRFKTKPSRGKGLHPKWTADNTVEFKHVLLPDLALIHFLVFDQKDQKPLGHFCTALDCIAAGYRLLPLVGARSPLAALFVNININIYVPNEHEDIAQKLTNPTKFSSVTKKHMAAMEDLVEKIEDDKDAACEDVAVETLPTELEFLGLSDSDDDDDDDEQEEIGSLRSVSSPATVASRKASVIELPSSSSPQQKTTAEQVGTTMSLLTNAALSSGLGEHFSEALAAVMMRSHHFEILPAADETCGHCDRNLPKKTSKCRGCGIVVHEGCSKVSVEEQKSVSCVFSGPTETKMIAKEKAAFQKTCTELNKQMATDKKLLHVLLVKDIKGLMRYGTSELKAVRKRAAKMSISAAEPAEKMREVYGRLIDRFLEYHAEVFASKQAALEKQAAAALEHQDKVNRIYEAELFADHDGQTRNAEVVLKTQQRKALTVLKKEAKQRKENWQSIKADIELRIVSMVNKTRKQLQTQHTGEQVLLRRQLDKAKQQLEQNNQTAAEELERLHKGQVAALQAQKGNEPLGWDQANATAAVAHLEELVDSVQ
eukprot:m.195978 g.195978  ORF g.195978 m.195978 type:complete len:1241 (-) comp18316_c0_seq18:1291-5013(-)